MESQLPCEKGPGKNKRKWNEKEDEKLVEVMLDILNSGSHFKADNGFKPGFFGAVETRLAALLPDAKIKAKPHIESRVKTLKSDWSAVHDMMSWNNTSGFGWDDQNKMLEAPQSVWQAYAQVHNNAAKWRGKKFPHYWDLCIVFGKDRANGRDAQTAADIISDINEQEETVDYTQGTGDGLEDIDVDAPQNTPLHAPSREESTTQRKRKRRNSWDPLMNSLKDSADIIASNIDNATNTFNAVFGIERDREDLRKKLNAEMKKVAGLTVRDCNKAVRMLSKNEELMVIFFTLEDEDKFEWVTDLLSDDA